jgi:hypothetical protein
MAEAKRTQWEYYVETIGSAFSGPKDEDLEEILNELGEQGWEVFSLEHLPNSPKVRLTAKRPGIGSSRRERSWPG